MWKTKILALLIATAGQRELTAQITPPGLGENEKANFWTAIGVRRPFGAAGKYTSISYLGLGRESTNDDFNIFKRQGIVVLNEAISYRLDNRWTFSMAASYRRQNIYKTERPYNRATPPYKHELRIYGKATHQIKGGKFNPSVTLRQELRRFYKPDMTPWKISQQLRTRVKLKTKYYVDQKKKQFVTTAGELLFSTARASNTSTHWDSFGYDEVRFSIFYSLQPRPTSAVYSIGYMNDLSTKDVHYLAFSIMFYWVNSHTHPHASS